VNIPEDINEITFGDFELYTAEYIDRLIDINDIYDSNTFTGLIRFINTNLIRSNTKQLFIDTIEAMQRLDNLFNCYAMLCYRYKQQPNLLEFSLLLGIDYKFFNAWLNGIKYNFKDNLILYNSGLNTITSSNNYYVQDSRQILLFRYELVSRWQAECRNNRIKGAGRGNVGQIFLTKALDGIRDDTPQTAQNITFAGVDALPDLSQAVAELSDNNAKYPQE